MVKIKTQQNLELSDKNGKKYQFNPKNISENEQTELMDFLSHHFIQRILKILEIQQKRKTV